MSKQWLITWNPNKWSWTNFDAFQAATMRGERKEQEWTCISKGPRVGDRVFLEVLGQNNIRGIIASGEVVEEPFTETTWRNTDGRMIKVSFDIILPLKYVLPQEILKTHFPETNWSTQRSGIEIRPTSNENSLETVWQCHVDSFKNGSLIKS
ncbi:MAG: EVE domain-containing protein [Victivallales bacterium]|nr:EVE domain-containing protein [Victivallales bacterium]